MKVYSVEQTRTIWMKTVLCYYLALWMKGVLLFSRVELTFSRFTLGLWVWRRISDMNCWLDYVQTAQVLTRDALLQLFSNDDCLASLKFGWNIFCGLCRTLCKSYSILGYYYNDIKQYGYCFDHFTLGMFLCVFQGQKSDLSVPKLACLPFVPAERWPQRKTSSKPWIKSSKHTPNSVPHRATWRTTKCGKMD